MSKLYDLPAPNLAQTERSNLLCEFIRQEINKQDGAISFSRFMDFALYHPDYGYYNSDTFTIGAGGDFTTAPEISPLFANCFVKIIAQTMNHLGTGAILEIGAGTGKFAKDLLLALNKFGLGPIDYFIFEKSAHLRKAQQELLSSSELTFTKIKWLDNLPAPFSGIIIANEVLDALPVHCFRFEQNAISERCVSYEDDAFIWKNCLPTTDLLREKAQELVKHYLLPDGYASEISLSLPGIIKAISTNLNQGVILFIDYGYGQKEYYHPLRQLGTLTCFYQHRKHDNPLILTGLQDITAHVDFTTVIETAAKQGCALSGFTSQAAFLLDSGIEDLAKEAVKNCSTLAEYQLLQAIKLLTAPNEMGERIKVMAITKQLELPLIGFSLDDRRRDL